MAYTFTSFMFPKSIITLFLGLFTLFTLTLVGCNSESVDKPSGDFQLLRVTASGKTLSATQSSNEIGVSGTVIIEFSSPVDTTKARSAIRLVNTENSQFVNSVYRFPNDARQVVVEPLTELGYNTAYLLEIGSALTSRNGVPFPGIQYAFRTENGRVLLNAATLNDINLQSSAPIRNIPYDNQTFVFNFSQPLDPTDFVRHFSVSPSIPFQATLSPDGKTVTLRSTSPASYYTRHTVSVSSSLTSLNQFNFAGYNRLYQTGLDPRPKLPHLSDEELLTEVQRATFRYFWDFGHPVSGLARERNSSGETVTIGGSGFGIMAILVGIERGFITRQQGIERLAKIVNFLKRADRFHGVWPHWMNGSSGRTIPFSTNDNGADLVETSFMAQGLITVRQYLDTTSPIESEIATEINTLLNTIEWNWFTRGGQQTLYWHWSPDKAWAMNMQIRGYNEALITYVLAASSESFAIEPQVYHNGWASNGGIRNGKTFYGITLPVGFDYGGPLFFAHYSFLGLDPRHLRDRYAQYWDQNRAHTLINRAHSIANPGNFVGYSADSWGLTASDHPTGYLAHEPTRDNGTITPTAALSSMPFTPQESMQALRHFYFVLGDKLWGDYGFYDAFNPTQAWWARSYLAIDQGPIILMIENHRTGLLWDLFMSAPEVQRALDKLDFNIEQLTN